MCVELTPYDMFSLLDDDVTCWSHDSDVFYIHCGMIMNIWRAHMQVYINHVFSVMMKRYVDKLRLARN